LIYRFAMKLEFGLLTTKVAEDAVRMVQRMSLDWMVMGRRPSGVCGACLILAARMNNFRRTITEVVYIVKVTTHTIQKRLDEFKLTPSSALTVEEFLNNEFLESAHDPPSFYEKSEEFQKNKKTRKRKRKGLEATEEEEEEDEGDEQNKRQKTATPNPDQALPTVELRRDADGFAIPPQPTPHHHNIPIDPDLIDEAIEDESGTSLQRLVEQFGDEVDGDDEEFIPNSKQRSRRSSRSSTRNHSIHVPDDWENDERNMESEISEMISDPNTVHHALSYAKAKRRAAYHMLIAEANNPQREVSMDLHIGEDEFADDPEVLNCMLSPEDVAKKEKLWVNENKVWLRKQQVKIYQKKMADQGPPKATRNRKKKPRIGEGQTSAASSPGEAAVAALKERTWSKKINYDAIRGMFDDSPTGSILGSAATSRRTSRAGSTIASSAAGSVAGDEESEMGDDESEAGESAPGPVKPLSAGMVAEQEEEEEEREEEEQELPDDDESVSGYHHADEEEEEVNPWHRRNDFKRPRGEGEFEDDEDDDIEYGQDGDFGDD
jgi:transcription factor IIIB subunit 2